MMMNDCTMASFESGCIYGWYQKKKTLARCERVCVDVQLYARVCVSELVSMRKFTCEMREASKKNQNK